MTRPCSSSMAIGALLLVGLASQASGRPAPQPSRVASVSDAIRMVNVADCSFVVGHRATDKVGIRSPDGELTAVVLKHGDIEHNTNEFSLVLIRMTDGVRSAKAEVLLTMASSSNRDAIAQLKWLRDSRSLLFLGETEGDVTAVFKVDIQTKRLEKVVHSTTPVEAYDSSSDGRVILYKAAALRGTDTESVRRSGVVITNQNPNDLFACGCNSDQEFYAADEELYVKVGQGAAERIAVHGFLTPYLPMTLDPTGRHALVSVVKDDIPAAWSGYKDDLLRRLITAPRRPGAWTGVQQYMLLDTATNILQPLVDAPVALRNGGHVWAEDGNSLIVSGIYLPLTVSDAGDRMMRAKSAVVADFSIPSKEIATVSVKDLRVSMWDQRTGTLLLEPGNLQLGSAMRPLGSKVQRGRKCPFQMCPP